MRVLRLSTVLILLFGLIACSSHSLAPTPTAGGVVVPLVQQSPDVLQPGKKPADWTQFTPPTSSGAKYVGIASGADKNIWFVDQTDGTVERVTMDGRFKAVSLGSAFIPAYIAESPDGLLYVPSSASPKIARIRTRDGHTTLLSEPNGAIPVGGIASVGNDIFFTTSMTLDAIDFVTGAIFTYNIPTPGAGGGGISVGPAPSPQPNGIAVWLTEPSFNKIAYFFNSTVTEIDLTPLGLSCNPRSIVNGSDGNVWFDCGNLIARMTNAGLVTTFPNPFGFAPSAQALTTGSDGQIWIATGRTDGTIAAFNTQTLVLSSFTPPYAGDVTNNIFAGPDKNIWVTTQTQGHIDVHILQIIKVKPNHVTFTAPGQTQTLTVSEPSTPQWNATSSDQAVATVSQGSSSNQFVVTAAGIGKTTLTVSDFIGNSYKLKVTVD